MKEKITAALAAGTLALTSAAFAEEGGVGHYNPGQTADIADAFPGYPSLTYENVFTYYDGSAGAGQRLPLAGSVALNLKATSYADTSVFLWETPLKVFGGYYSTVVSVPYVWTTVKGDLTVGPLAGRRSDSVDGLGDIYFLPAAVGWTNGDFKWDGRFGVYAPTGAYSKYRLANAGLNYWTFEPEATFTWLSSKIGLEVSAFAGIDFNTENSATDYQSGDIFHLDLTVAEHVPLLGGFVGVGANGFYLQQFTGDSGSGATLGSFEVRQLGVGPVLSYVRKIGKTQLLFDVKWLPQLDTQHTMKGDFVWAKLALVF